MVGPHAAFGQWLLDVTEGQAVALIPAHRHRDHLGREQEPANADRAAGNARGRVASLTRPSCSIHNRRMQLHLLRSIEGYLDDLIAT
jgi:hypothetical protein